MAKETKKKGLTTKIVLEVMVFSQLIRLQNLSRRGSKRNHRNH